MRAPTFQKYPRNEHDQLDETKLKPHSRTLAEHELKSIVKRAIQDANKKSSHVLLNIPEGTSEVEAAREYKKSGENLYKFFTKNCDDPAGIAHQCYGRHYKDVAREQLKAQRLERENVARALRDRYIQETLTREGYKVPSCIEIAHAVMDVLIETNSGETESRVVTDAILYAFGECCRKDGLLNKDGIFHDPYAMLQVFAQ